MRLVDALPAPAELRMADFARWGRAVATAIGRDPGDFDAAYRAALLRQSGDVVESDPVALAVIEFAKRHPAKLGTVMTADEFFPDLVRIARDLRVHADAWPARKESLSSRLRVLTPTLKALGYELIKLVRTPEYRSRWRLTKAGG